MARSRCTSSSSASGTTGSALRRRVLGVRAREAEEDSDGPSTVLGSARANAYFNAKRLKQATVSSRQSEPEPNAHQEQEQKNQEEKAKGTATATEFVVQPASETKEILRRLDAREDARRRASKRLAWPSYEQARKDGPRTNSFYLFYY
jgi:hypothetical protein